MIKVVEFAFFALPFFHECRQRQTRNMKLSKYIVLSLLLFMCHHLSWVHCSDTEKVNSDTSPQIPGDSSIGNAEGGQKVDDIQTKDGMSKSTSTCLETDEDCSETKGGEKHSVSSEYIPTYKEKFSRPANQPDDSGSTMDSSHLHMFSNYDRTMKGYLTKNDVAAFLQYKSSGTKVSVLEANLFISCLDTDFDGKVSLGEYYYATSGHIKNLATATFDRLRSETIDCIYEEDLELLSDNVEFDFLLLDTNYDDCFSMDELEEFLHRFGFELKKSNTKVFDDNENDENVVDSIIFSDFTDGTESLYFPEGMDFSAIMEERKYSSIEDAIDALWESIDENSDGYISLEELAADLEWYGFEAAEKVAEPLFSLIDVNMDEIVSSEELKTFFINPPTQNVRIKEWMDTFWDNNDMSEIESEDGSNPPDIPQWKEKSSLAFIVFDKNRNGYIERDELRNAMESHRRFHSEALADSVTDFIDRDNDRRISLAEFGNALSSMGAKIEVQYVDEFGNPVETVPETANITSDVKIAFERIDKDSDGFIASKELKYFLHLRMDILTDDDLKDIFNTLDVNKNGLIAQSDVQTFLTFSPKKTYSKKEEISLEAFKKIAKNALIETVTDEEVNLQFSALDINRDSLVSSKEFQMFVILYEMTDESEFITWIEEARFREGLKEMDVEFNDAFELFDQDRNEFIDMEEFGIALNKLKGNNLKAGDVEECFIKLDMNGDDFISKDEFIILLWKRKE